VPDTTADCSDLENVLGYSPKVNVEEGVANFVRWYREYYRE
jgi:UDP-glucuronate 4-epimerase